MVIMTRVGIPGPAAADGCPVLFYLAAPIPNRQAILYCNTNLYYDFGTACAGKPDGKVCLCRDAGARSGRTFCHRGHREHRVQPETMNHKPETFSPLRLCASALNSFCAPQSKPEDWPAKAPNSQAEHDNWPAKGTNWQAKGTNWRAKSERFQSFCHTFQDLRERRAKNFLPDQTSGPEQFILRWYGHRARRGLGAF